MGVVESPGQSRTSALLSPGLGLANVVLITRLESTTAQHDLPAMLGAVLRRFMLIGSFIDGFQGS